MGTIVMEVSNYLTANCTLHGTNSFSCLPFISADCNEHNELLENHILFKYLSECSGCFCLANSQGLKNNYAYGLMLCPNFYNLLEHEFSSICFFIHVSLHTSSVLGLLFTFLKRKAFPHQQLFLLGMAGLFFRILIPCKMKHF